MATNYEKISEEHREGYGAWSGRYGKHFHKDFYSDPTHFIFELLQNTEDALKQAGVKEGDVKFTLESDRLSLSHNGKPFDEADVRSICHIGESTKSDDITTIGKFGIGFKSVYDFTNTPQIFSGDEHFEIRDYVLPHDAPPPTDLKKNETRIVLPFIESKEQYAFEKIEKGLNNLRGRAILFLRHIKTLKWQVGNDKPSYITQEEERLDDFARRVTITDHDGTKETWLIFSQGEEIETRVEIAFLSKRNPKTDGWSLFPYKDGKNLYSYFPVDSEVTDLKFLVQGAFQTTKNRASLPEDSSHNDALIGRISDLLIKILLYFKKQKILNWNFFDYLPIEDDFFDDDCLFLPMAEKIRHALEVEKLLPARGGGFVLAEHAKIPENKKLMQNFDNKKISKFFGNEKIRWLQIGLSPKVKGFLSQRLEIESLSLFQIMDKKYITPAFMRQQKDEWVQNLYVFLFDEEFYPDSPKLKKNMNNYYARSCRYQAIKTLPLIRLEKGRKHIPSHNQNNEPQVYLPPAPEGIKTIKATTIKKGKAKDFIESLGIEIYDDTNGLIDEIRNRYAKSHVSNFSLPTKQYKRDIKRIIEIQQNDKIDEYKKEKFGEKLKRIAFVKAKNMENGDVSWKCPDEVYLATENFETLFSGIEIYLVDDALMEEEDADEMLTHYGAKDYIQLIEIDECHLSKSEEKKLFLKTNKDNRSNMRPSQKYHPQTINHNIEHLDVILASFEGITKKEQKNKAKALWEALAIPRPKNSQLVAKTRYTNDERIDYDAKFIHTLNNAEWIPAPDGTLKKPEFVFFDELKWELSSFTFFRILQSKIHFKKSETKQAQERLNLDDEALEREKKIAEIREKMANDKATPKEIEWYKMATTPFPLEDAPPEATEESHETNGEDVEPTPAPTAPPRIQQPISKRGERGRQNRASTPGTAEPPSTTSPPRTTGGRVGGIANPAVEKAAIEAVRDKYPKLKDANDEIRNNPGFDLYEESEGKRVKWIEVKGVEGEYDGIPRMTSTQFGFALGLNALGAGDKYIHITVAHALTNPDPIEVPDPADEEHIIDNEEEIDNSNDD